MRSLFILLWLLVVCVAEELSTGDDLTNFVREKIRAYEVMVFAKSYCPYCQRTRALLQKMQESTGINVHVLDLDQMDQEDGPLIQMELLKKTGQRTVPNIFIDQKHIGGNDVLQDLARTGQLKQMLSEVVHNRDE